MARALLLLAELPAVSIETNLSVMGLEVELKMMQSWAYLLSQDIKSFLPLFFTAEWFVSAE